MLRGTRKYALSLCRRDKRRGRDTLNITSFHEVFRLLQKIHRV